MQTHNGSICWLYMGHSAGLSTWFKGLYCFITLQFIIPALFEEKAGIM